MKTLFQIVILASFFLLCSCDKELKYTYYPDGKVKEQYEQKHGKKDGECVYYYENGFMEAKGEFKRGKMNGIWTYYYPDGKIMITQKIQNGKNLIFDGWDQNGHKVIENGTGTITTFYSNGYKKSTNTYKNGHLDGINQSWYPDGTIEFEQFFDTGKPIGTWRAWDKEGNIIYEEIFE